MTYPHCHQMEWFAKKEEIRFYRRIIHNEMFNLTIFARRQYEISLKSRTSKNLLDTDVVDLIK